jgi:1,2-diacylglycerol 3-beta-glucosyltransferase
MNVITFIIILVTAYCYILAAVSQVVRKSSASNTDELFFVLLVPVLNEEHVIGRTLAHLLALSGEFIILVIDDASDDGTVAVVTSFLTDRRVRLLERQHPQARHGKGDSLNAGFAAVQHLQINERYRPENIIVVVFDADAQVELNFLTAITPYFRDTNTAGVQCAVRMYNAERNLLTLWQHLEFTIWDALFCQAKDWLGSATLGGNGQSVRLSALAVLGTAPWRSSSLTEDLDLSLRLIVSGWRLRFCPTTAVWQEAVPGLRRLVRQRSRWLQGHLVCWQYVPALLRAGLPTHIVLDLLVFLFLPVLFLPIGLVSITSWQQFWEHLGRWNMIDLLAWYVLGFGMAPLAAAAWARSERPGLRRALLHGHSFIFYSVVWLLAVVVAYWNIMLGRRAWAKTSRVAPVPAIDAQPSHGYTTLAYATAERFKVLAPVMQQIHDEIVATQEQLDNTINVVRSFSQQIGSPSEPCPTTPHADQEVA